MKARDVALSVHAIAWFMTLPLVSFNSLRCYELRAARLAEIVFDRLSSDWCWKR